MFKKKTKLGMIAMMLIRLWTAQVSAQPIGAKKDIAAESLAVEKHSSFFSHKEENNVVKHTLSNQNARRTPISYFRSRIAIEVINSRITPPTIRMTHIKVKEILDNPTTGATILL